MSTKDYLEDLNAHISYLYSFAAQINELDFAMALSGEARGDQGPGWSTTITAHEVFDEITELTSKSSISSKQDIRLALLLYCQLAEAGGYYETIQNMIGVLAQKPYVMWPFQHLVRVKQEPKRIIGPNANATFRQLASAARAVGLTRLSDLLADAFRDDIRNGIAHSDYIIWEDGLRLRKRNGGFAKLLAFGEVNAALARGINFFQILRSHNTTAAQSYYPSKEIVGRLSMNHPMPWTVSFDPSDGSFSISGSSPGPVKTPELARQDSINSLLGGRALALYIREDSQITQSIEGHLNNAGFEPQVVVLPNADLNSLRTRISNDNLWDERLKYLKEGEALFVSPWGFKAVNAPNDLDGCFPQPMVRLQID